MYNRYIPQPDGSYRRNAMPDPRQNPSRHPQRRKRMRSLTLLKKGRMSCDTVH